MQQNNYKTELLYVVVFFGVFALMHYPPKNISPKSSSPISHVEMSSTTEETPFNVFPAEILDTSDLSEF